MTAFFQALTKGLPQLVLALALLAFGGALGATNHLAASDVLAIITAVIGASGISAGIILGSSSSNISLTPHFFLFLAAMGVLAALVIEGTLTGTEAYGALGFLVGAGALGGGAAASAAARATKGPDRTR